MLFERLRKRGPLVAALALVTLAARADTVVTTGGKTHTGKAEWVAGGIEIAPAAAGAAKVTVPLDWVASAAFDLPADAAAVAVSNRPADWAGFDVGAKAQPGRAEVTRGSDAGGLVALFDSAGNSRTAKKKGADKADSVFLYGQKARGDFVLTARLRTMDENRLARAGLMVRGGLDADAAFALASRGTEGETALSRRTAAGAAAEDAARSPNRIFGATWLRLERKGNTIAAAESTDGKGWTAIGSCDVPMDEEVYVGLAACSGTNPRDGGRTVFDRVSLAAAGPAEAAARVPRGLATVGGSIVAGDVGDTDGAQIAFTPTGGAARRVPIAQVARCILTPLLPAADDKLRTAGPGVLMVNGDYLEGEVKGIENGAVHITSVLFGARTIPLRREAAAVVFRPAGKPAGAAFEVRLADRSLIRATAVEAKAGGVKIVEPTVGEIEAKAVVEIRRVK